MTPKREDKRLSTSGAQTGSARSSRPMTMSLDPRHGHERPPVETPSQSDVLAGRGNACNYHPGNECFRALVSKHKRAYVACSKPQKAKFSRLIVDEIYSRNGRFLKQDTTTKLWHDIGDKKALDKARQALREGAPELLKEIKTCDLDSDVALAERYPSMAQVGSAPPDNAAFAAAGIAAGGIVETPFAPLLHVSIPAPASTPVAQNRSRPVNYRSMHQPSLGALPAQLVANAHRQTNQEMEALHRKLAALYTPDQFEPTPINPNLQLITMRESIRVEPTTPVRDMETLPSRRSSSGHRLERSESTESLDIRKVFTAGNTEELSQQLSNMSFSVGEIAAISDESNLSSVFDESTRTRDNSGEKAKTQKCNNKSMNGLNGFNDMSLTSLVGVESNFAADESNTLGNLLSFAGDSNLGNMSSLASEFNVGSFMSTTSISKIFDESTDKM